MIWKYNEEEYNTWVETHEKWMRDNLPPAMVESFEAEVGTSPRCMEFSLTFASSLQYYDYGISEQSRR